MVKKQHAKKETIDPRVSDMSQQRPVRSLFGDDRDTYLARLGFRNLRVLHDYKPMQSTRTLAAVAQGLIPRPQLAGLVKEDFSLKDATEALSWPVTALHIPIMAS